MNTYIPMDEPFIRICGRTKATNPLPLFWTGSGVEFVVDGSDCEVDFYTSYTCMEQWIRVEIDGFEMIRQPLSKGYSTINIFRNMDPAEKKRVRIIKEVQPMRNDPGNVLLLNEIRADGSLYELPKKSCRLEFIGDSITSGEGLAGSKDTHAWIPMIFSTRGHYALSLENTINADVRILSQSGWGTYSSWDNRPQNVMPKYYEQICGVLIDDSVSPLGAYDKHDFASWQPDAVIVNLGTNDGGAFSNPPYIDEETGISYKQVMNEDGTLEKESCIRFENAVYDFLVKLRNNNPDSYIIWVYGMLGDMMRPYIENVLSRYKEECKDEKVELLMLPDTDETSVGANNHPGYPVHRKASKVIENELKRLKIVQ